MNVSLFACCELRHRRVEASSVGLSRHWRRTFWTLLMIATLKITMLKWQHCKFDYCRWLFLFSFAVNVNEQRIIASLTEKCCYWTLRSKVPTHLCDLENFTTVQCRISTRLKWYKNCKNRLRLAKVIVKKCHVFMVHCVVMALLLLIRYVTVTLTFDLSTLVSGHL